MLEVFDDFWWADNRRLLAETANSRVEHIADLHFCRNGEVMVLGGREGSTLSHSDKVGRVSLLRRKTSHYVPYARKKKTDILSDVRFFLVGAKGLEPLTSCV